MILVKNVCTVKYFCSTLIVIHICSVDIIFIGKLKIIHHVSTGYDADKKIHNAL